MVRQRLEQHAPNRNRQQIAVRNKPKPEAFWLLPPLDDAPTLAPAGDDHRHAGELAHADEIGAQAGRDGAAPDYPGRQRTDSPEFTMPIHAAGNEDIFLTAASRVMIRFSLR